MLKWVYEFNQEKLLALQTDTLKITPSDVLILHSVVNSVCSVKMQTIYEDNKVYVWIDHTNLLEQLPILGINSKQRLSTILKKFKDLGLIITKNIANHGNKGSKSFVALTDTLIDCLSNSAKEAHDSKKEQLMKRLSENRPVNENAKSINTQYNSNKKDISKDISNNKKNSPKQSDSFLRTKKPKSKKFTYQDCIACINNYTNDEKLRRKLIDFLNLRLSMMKDKPMRMESWKTLLEKLDIAHEQSSPDVTKLDIVFRAIERAYTTFYPINNKSDYSGSVKSKPWESGVKSEPVVEQQTLVRRRGAKHDRQT